MTNSMNRNVYRSLVILSFLLINALILFGISSAVAYMNSGADRTDILHLSFIESTFTHPNINYETKNCIGRELSNLSISSIENDYMHAWKVRNNTYQTNTMNGVDGYYTDSAQTELADICALNNLNKVNIYTSNLCHNIDFSFFSADGQLVVFDDTDVTQITSYTKSDEYLFTQRNKNNYKVMMLLEDGYWRIRHLTLEKTEDISSIPIIESSSKLKAFISSLKGTNYYPQDQPWTMFDDDYDSITIDKDFALMHSMGLNTVRLFVQYEDFGKEYLLEDKLLKLGHTLDLASKNKLNVILTLFDFYGNYAVSDIVPCVLHAEQIVNRFKDHPSLLAWDIKNEPDLDFDSRGKENVITWLEEMIRQIRLWDEENLLTIGWSSAEKANLLSEYLDIVSFHDYLDPNTFYNRVDTLQKLVNNKPLILQEYGYTSYSGIWNLFSGSQEKQVEYYNTIQKQVSELNIAYIFWTLYDFSTVPNSVVGMKPWLKNRQQNFGIIDSNGNKKAAYHIFDTSKIE